MINILAYFVIFISYLVFTIGLGNLFDTNPLTSTTRDNFMDGFSMQLVMISFILFAVFVMWSFSCVSL